MSLEDKFKKLLGEYAFQIVVLQHQLDELKEENQTLKERSKEKKT